MAEDSRSRQAVGVASAAARGESSSSKSGRGFLIGGAAALLLVGALAVGTLHQSAGTPHLIPVPKSEIAAMSTTLDPAKAPQIVAQAQACQVPLLTAQIYHDPGAPDATVQIKSGSYVSPPFTITGTPSVIAIPPPAPYPTGAGQLTILGNAQDVEFLVRSTLSIPEISGSATVNSYWKTGNPCQ